MKVIVTSGAWQSALACTQSLGRRGHEVYLVDDRPSALGYSRFCRSKIQSPPEIENTKHIAFLRELVKEGRFDVLMPISDSVVRECVRDKEALEAGVRVLLPDLETFSVAADKSKLYTFAQKQNIRIPETYFPSCFAQVESLARENIFPCVVKLPVSGAGKGIFYINNREELARIYRSEDFDGQWPVVQEFVDGDFFGLSCIASKGKVLIYFMYKTPRKYSMEGTPPILFSVKDDGLLAQAKDIIGKLGWSGAINLDFLKDSRRGYVLLEVNPRFGGTLNFAYRMGVDLPWAYCQAALGRESAIEQPDYLSGVMFRTIFPTEVLRCRASKGYWRTFIKNFFTPQCKTNIYWDDPRLLWGQIKETRWYLQDLSAKHFPGGMNRQ